MIEVTDEAKMRAFGEQLGRLFRGGEIIELVGDVGAGKTTLVRGIAEGMGVTETVQSPSFTISRVYEADQGRKLVHYDFYRLQDAGIMADELAETVGDEKAAVVIEWAAAVEEVLPADRLTIAITSPGETVRQLRIGSGGSVSKSLEEKLQ